MLGPMHQSGTLKLSMCHLADSTRWALGYRIGIRIQRTQYTSLQDFPGVAIKGDYSTLDHAIPFHETKISMQVSALE